MPELPEVETVMRGLEPVMTGAEISEVWCGDKGLRIQFPEGLANRLKGAEIRNLNRRAKYILVHLNCHPEAAPKNLRHENEILRFAQNDKKEDHILAIHLGMSGRVRLLAPGSNAPPEVHDHFIIRLTSGHQIILNDARRFGMVFDFPAMELEGHKAFCHLGPEPLLSDFSSEYLQARLKTKATAIKTAIMDQRLVVGVGNIYACEALFRAGISPTKKASRLSGKEIKKLTLSIKQVIETAIKAGGTTLRDHRLPDGNFGYFQQELYVYGRVGDACLNKCGAEIARLVQGGRSTFYCPSCQK